MKSIQKITPIEYNLLLQDCIEFYPIFVRHPTHQEIETWAEMRHITFTDQTITQILRHAKKRINETLT